MMRATKEHNAFDVCEMYDITFIWKSFWLPRLIYLILCSKRQTEANLTNIGEISNQLSHMFTSLLINNLKQSHALCQFSIKDP